MKKSCLLIIIFFLKTWLFPQTDTSQVVPELEIRYVNEFNRLPIGCRNNSLGNSGVILYSSQFAGLWNPSLTSIIHNYSIDLEGVLLYGNLSQSGSVYIKAGLASQIAVAIAYSAFFSDNIYQWDSLENDFDVNKFDYPENGYIPVGIFHDNQHRIVVNLSKNFSVSGPRLALFSLPVPLDFAVGINIKFLWETITPDDKVRVGMNTNADAGFTVRLGTDYDFTNKKNLREIVAGFAVFDFIPTVKTWIYSPENYEEPVDMYYDFAIGYNDFSGFLHSDWSIVFGVKRDYNTYFHGGIEALIEKIAAVRLGFYNKIFTAGLGFKYKFINIDYSFSFDELAWTWLRLGTSFSF